MFINNHFGSDQFTFLSIPAKIIQMDFLNKRLFHLQQRGVALITW